MVVAAASAAAPPAAASLAGLSLYHCLISFSRGGGDREFAMKLREQLKAQEVKAWVDEHDLVGKPIDAGCKQAIRSSAVFCCLTSKVCSSYQLDEIEYAHDVVPLLRHITVLRPETPVGPVPIEGQSSLAFGDRRLACSA
jgi:hypothetical protein